MKITLMEGQKVLGIDGKTYLIEKGDCIVESRIDNGNRKLFISYAEEIIENILNRNPDFAITSKSLWEVVRLMGLMALPENNPNYVNALIYLPTGYVKSLFDNSTGGNRANIYDSVWMSIRDDQQYLVVKQAAKNLGYTV